MSKLLVALSLGAFLATTLMPVEAATRPRRVAIKVDPQVIAPVCPPRKLPSPN